MENCLSSSVPKVERKVIEKNRRNLMKGLCAQLQSLLPNHGSNSREKLQLTDQIDEAVKYVKSLQMKVEKSKQKKEYLLPKKRPHSCVSTSDNLPPESTNLPLIEIHEMGPSMDVILVKGLDSISKFRDIVCLLHEEGVKIINATFSIHENSMFQIVHEEKTGKSTSRLGAKALSRRLKELFSGASSNDMESQQLWDFEIDPSLWWSELAEVVAPLFV